MKLRTLVATAALVVGAMLSVFHAQDAGPQVNLTKEFVWRPIGPVNMGGRIDDIEAVESDPAVIYVGAATGGGWRSVQSGPGARAVQDDRRRTDVDEVEVHRRRQRLRRRRNGSVEQPGTDRGFVPTPPDGVGIQRRRTGQRLVEDDRRRQDV